jgi:GNAT superfamily N-acetyltransferase
VDYEQITLAHAAQHFDRLVEIVDDVRLKQGLAPINAMAALQGFAKRGDTAALAWDDGQLMGLTCLGLCHHFIAGTEWLPVKLHLARLGINLATLGCSHFVYLDPAHWGAGHTSALTEAARRSNPAITHTLSHSFATPALETWAAKLPGMQDLNMPGPDGGRVFVREVG